MEEKEEVEKYLPPRKIKNHEHIIQVTAMKFEDLKRISSSNQTGAFSHMSARGNRYIIVMEDSDEGPILATAIKSSHKEHLLERFKEIHDTLTKTGINPVLHQIDNEFLKDNRRIRIKGIKISNSTKRKSPNGSGRTRNSNIEEPLSISIIRMRSKVPEESMG